MNHLEFAAYESSQLEETSWDRWIKEAQKIAGHDLDGDDDEDGYSLDSAFNAYIDDRTPSEYVCLFKWRLRNENFN